MSPVSLQHTDGKTYTVTFDGEEAVHVSAKRTGSMFATGQHVWSAGRTLTPIARTVIELAKAARHAQAAAPPAPQPKVGLTVDSQEFQELLLATEVASPDRDDGPHMRRQYDERRAALVAYVNAELAAARVAGLLEAAKLAEECMTCLGAAEQIRALAAKPASEQAEPSASAPDPSLGQGKLCYCTGGPNNHQSGCTEGFPSDLPDYAS